MGNNKSNGKEFEWRVRFMMKALGIRVIRDPLPGSDEGSDLLVGLPTQLGGVSEAVVQCKETCIEGVDVDRLCGTMIRKKKPLGILITGGSATRPARKYIKGLKGLVLIEGEELAKLEEKSYIGFRLNHISQNWF